LWFILLKLLKKFQSALLITFPCPACWAVLWGKRNSLRITLPVMPKDPGTFIPGLALRQLKHGRPDLRNKNAHRDLPEKDQKPHPMMVLF